jgi:hypothetical protein
MIHDASRQSLASVLVDDEQAFDFTIATILVERFDCAARHELAISVNTDEKDIRERKRRHAFHVIAFRRIKGSHIGVRLPNQVLRVWGTRIQFDYIH